MSPARMIKPIPESIFAKRRKRLAKMLGDDIAILPSASMKIASRDMSHQYRPDSDMLYFCGFDEPDAAICIHGPASKKQFTFFLRDKDATAERWGDKRLGLTAAKRKYDFDNVLSYESLPAFLAKNAKSETLLFPPGVNDAVDTLIWNHFRTSLGPQVSFAHSIKDIRVLTSQLRVIKDIHEQRRIREAIKITEVAFAELCLALKERSLESEHFTARVLETFFTKLGASGPGFETIVAAGANATFLHHMPSSKSLSRDSLLLIDAGAKFEGYSSDITRVFPLKKKFRPAEAAIYDLVHKALYAGIKEAKPGSSLSNIHNRCVRTLTKGLIDLKLLKGSVASCIKNASYRRFFMHGSGHWLGLDVHDISPIHMDEFSIPSPLRLLEPGNIFTIEPGLYFAKNDKSIPKEFRGIGIRLEEDILITKDSAEVLSEAIPVKRSSIEELFSD